MNKNMGIRELGERVGVAPHTLRYYEDAGLMISVPRDDAGRRRYGEDHLRWVAFLLRLREGGMGIARIREYVDLLQSDADATAIRRREILRVHRQEVRGRIDRLEEHLRVLDRKVGRGCAPEPAPTLQKEDHGG